MENKKEMKSGQGKAMLRMIGYMVKQYKLQCFVVVACIIGSALCMVKSNLFMQSLIDDYILPMMKENNLDFAPLGAALLQLGTVLAVGVLCSFAYSFIMVYVSQGTMRDIREKLFVHMESLPIRYFDTHPHGDVMSVYTNDVDTLRQLLSQSIPQLLNSAVTLVITFFGMISLDISLTALSVVMICFMLFVTSRLSGRSAVYFTEQQKDIGQVNAFVEEMMDGQKVVKVFCHEEKSIEDFRKINRKLEDSSNNANRIANILMPINANIGNISYVLCAIVGALLTLTGILPLSVGTLISFLSLNKTFTQPVIQISQQLNSVIMALAGSQRITELLDEESEQDEGYVELVNAKELPDGTLTETAERTGMWAWKHPHQADGTVTYRRMEGGVTFGGVDFGYDDSKMVLHDIKLFAEPGQKIAFVGGTGAGKTTITNLINRFYDIQDGKIRYDDINIRKIKKSALRSSLGIVLQDTHLFTGTVMDNIRYGRLDATDKECIAAAKLANAHDFIKRLPDGYETVLTGDGANLSQGQRQLLAIARAAVNDPPVLILDEATSSIDTRTEALVQKGMDALMKGRTSFVIAHRLSTVRNSDCIMVLEQGRIIERGTHDQLIEKKGKYYQLYTGKSSH